MKNKFLIVFLSAFLILSMCLPSISNASDIIQWYSYADAKTLVNKNKNKVFLYFYSNSCYYCGLMEKNTFSNSTFVQYLNQNFIPIKVNSDKDKNISTMYNIRGNPTNYFLTENFEIIGNIPGYLPPEDLLNLLKYVHTDSFKKMTLDDFLQKSN